MLEYFAIFSFAFLGNWWYFTHKYNSKVNDLVERIEDLIVEKHRLRKDIVGLLGKIGEHAEEVSQRERTIRGLEEKIEDLQRISRQKRVRSEPE